MYHKNITAYAWQFTEKQDSNDLNLAVSDRDCDQMADYIELLKNGNNFSISLRKIPKGNPHHTDNPLEILSRSMRIFRSLDIVVIKDLGYEISALTEDERLMLDIPKNLVPYFSDSLIKSKTSAYIWDNSVRITLLDENNEILKGELFFWSCNNNHIIYY